MIHEPEQHTRAMLPDDGEPESLTKPYPGEAIKLDVVKLQAVLPAAPDRPRRSRIPLLVVGLALVLFAAVGAGFWWGVYTASQKTFIQGSVGIQVPKVSTQAQPVSLANEPGIFRIQQVISVGDGPLSRVTYSDGMAPYSDSYLHLHHPGLQRIWYADQPGGCDVARISSDQIWFVTHAPAAITVNGQTIAQVSQDTIADGYTFDWPVRVGDQLCLNSGQPNTTPRSFYLYFGPDIRYYQDSHCYRGNCVAY